MMKDGNQFLKVSDVAKRLNVTPMTVYRMIRRGQIPCQKIGSQTQIAQDDLEAYITQNRKDIPGGEGVKNVKREQLPISSPLKTAYNISANPTYGAQTVIRFFNSSFAKSFANALAILIEDASRRYKKSPFKKRSMVQVEFPHVPQMAAELFCDSFDLAYLREFLYELQKQSEEMQKLERGEGLECEVVKSIVDVLDMSAATINKQYRSWSRPSRDKITEAVKKVNAALGETLK